MDDSKAIAMNIVNQILDLAEASVEKRQAINDQCDEFVTSLLAQQKQELLDALTIEKQQPKHPYGKDDGVKLLCTGFNNCVDELEARKHKLTSPDFHGIGVKRILDNLPEAEAKDE